MRPIVFLVLALTASQLVAQDGFFSGPQIAEGAARSFAELEAKVAAKERLIAELQAIVKELEAKLDCVCGEGCQCDAGGSPCPCAAKSASPWKITMESIPRCRACIWSETNDKPRYLATGWQWHTEHLPGPQPGVRSYPRYLLCNDKTCLVVEISNTSELDGKVREAIAEYERSAFGKSLGVLSK